MPGGFVDRTVYLNEPAIWQFDYSSSHYDGQKALIEPFIINFEKFNSNTGWRDDGRCKVWWPFYMPELQETCITRTD